MAWASAACMLMCIGVHPEDESPHTKNPFNNFTTKAYYMSHWLFEVVEALLRHEYLWCDRLSGEEELSGIFNCEAAPKIFTSSDLAFSDIARPWVTHSFVPCGVVLVARPLEGVEPLITTTKFRHGIWHAKVASCRRYVFPWGSD